MTELSFRVPACTWWSTNARVHHMKRSIYTAEWRAAAHTVARAAAGYRWQPLERWAVQAQLAFGGWTPRSKRLRDAHNYTGTVLKACIDGLVDAGIAVADDSDHLLYTGIARHPKDGLRFPPGVYLTVQAAYLTREAS